MSAEDIAAAVLAGFNTDEDGSEKSEGGLSSGAAAKDTEEGAKEPDTTASTAIRTSSSTKAKAPKKDENKSTPKKYNKKPKEEHKFPIPPRIVQIIKKPRTYVDHSYRDFASVPPEIGHQEPVKAEDMSFAQKVHHILSQEEYSKYVSWTPHGRSFRVDVPVMFERLVCEKYFGHKRYSSFLRQLNTHGFKHLTKGQDRNTYYHEFFLRGLPHLCQYMPQPRDARRLIPDPENEPNFNAISQMWPVPTKRQTNLARQEQAPHLMQASYLVRKLGGVPRLASEVSWMENAMPLAKRQVMLPTMLPSANTVLHRSAPPALSLMAQSWRPLGLQQVPQTHAGLLNAKSNSALAAASLRAQLHARAQMAQQTLNNNRGPTVPSMSIGDWLRSQR